MQEGTSAATRDALCSMLEELRANGVRDVHFLVHSLGSTVVLRSICDDPEKRIARLFAECEPPPRAAAAAAATGRDGSSPTTSSSGPLPLLRLKTFTLLHPDCSLRQFVSHDFAILRRLCNHLTVLGDKNDQALFWSERVNRDFDLDPALEPSWRRAVGRSVRSVGRAVFALHAGDAVAAGDGGGGGGGTRSPRRGEKRWLDLDALDTSWMDQNVHALRHNYFTLNPTLVEDLVELVVTGKRAVDRSLLLRREGNIFSYCSAPSCVVND